jgi:uncharacterized phage-associated protein
MINDFDFMKVTQVLNYLAIKLGGKVDKLRAIKLLYLADKYHLRKYGRLVTGDQYIAMKLGPVQSGVKDIADLSDFLDSEERDYASLFIKKEGHDIKSIRKIDYDELSQTDVEALNFVLERFGSLSDSDLIKLTHKGYEWRKHESELKLKSRVDIDILDFFEDSEDDGISKITKDTKEAALGFFKEDMEVNAILR